MILNHSVMETKSVLINLDTIVKDMVMVKNDHSFRVFQRHGDAVLVIDVFANVFNLPSLENCVMTVRVVPFQYIKDFRYGTIDLPWIILQLKDLTVKVNSFLKDNPTALSMPLHAKKYRHVCDSIAQFCSDNGNLRYVNGYMF